MKTGKVWRHVCAGMLAGGLMLPLSVRAVNEPIKIQVTIENLQPTCSINVPGGDTRNLGALNRSGKDQSHSAFTIEVNCNGNVKTRMKANATSGAVQSDGTRLAVNMGGSTSSAGPFLKLKADNRFVKLRDSDNDWFCTAGTAGNTQRCSVTPVTESSKQTPAGAGSATVAFTIDYFL